MVRSSHNTSISSNVSKLKELIQDKQLRHWVLTNLRKIREQSWFSLLILFNIFSLHLWMRLFFVVFTGFRKKWYKRICKWYFNTNWQISFTNKVNFENIKERKIIVGNDIYCSKRWKIMLEYYLQHYCFKNEPTNSWVTCQKDIISHTSYNNIKILENLSSTAIIRKLLKKWYQGMLEFSISVN